MKQSIMTGKQIYDELKKIRKDLDELGQACDLISDDLGQQHVAYVLLNKQYVEKERELRMAEAVRYVVHEPNSSFNF